MVRIFSPSLNRRSVPMPRLVSEKSASSRLSTPNALDYFSQRSIASDVRVWAQEGKESTILYCLLKGEQASKAIKYLVSSSPMYLIHKYMIEY